MNDIIASLYDPWFNYDIYKPLLDCVFNAFDFQKLGFGFIISSILGLVIFYKFWDPVKKPRTKWLISLVLIAIIMFIATYVILFQNVEILQYMGNYSGDVAEVNPDYFIFQMAAISFLFGFIISVLLSFVIKYFSVANKHNPI